MPNPACSFIAASLSDHDACLLSLIGMLKRSGLEATAALSGKFTVRSETLQYGRPTPLSDSISEP